MKNSGQPRSPMGCIIYCTNPHELAVNFSKIFEGRKKRAEERDTWQERHTEERDEWSLTGGARKERGTVVPAAYHIQAVDNFAEVGTDGTMRRLENFQINTENEEVPASSRQQVSQAIIILLATKRRNKSPYNMIITTTSQ